VSHLVVQRAPLRGEGNFTLVPTMSRHLVSNAIWLTSTAGWKAQLFERFLCDTGTRQMASTVTSKDSLLLMPATPQVARKPGQKS